MSRGTDYARPDGAPMIAAFTQALVHAETAPATDIGGGIRSMGLPRAKAAYGRTAFRFALEEIAALVGLATDKPRRPPVQWQMPVRCAVVRPP